MKYKLICMDMDGVLLDDTRNTWMEVHKAFGTLEEGTRLTERYLYTDYDTLVEEVVGKLWKGRDATPYIQMCEELPLMRGVDELFAYIKDNHLISAIISGGSMRAARRIDAIYGVDHVFANELVIKDNIVTGEFLWPVGIGYQAKARIVRHLAQDHGVEPAEIVYVGDSTNDVEAFKFVGLAIAFNTDDQRVRDAADVIVEGNNLCDVVAVLRKYH